MTLDDRKALEEALKQCESEQIHLLGQIQPQGVLIVLSNDIPVKIIQASDNIDLFFKIPARKVLGKPLSELIGQGVAEEIERLIARCRNLPLSATVYLLIDHIRLPFQARVFKSNESFVLELIPDPATPDYKQLSELLSLIQKQLLFDENLASKDSFFNSVAKLVRQITGFDRVNILRFDSFWNGEVICEDRIDSADSYLGLHFPASDIPSQARKLYQNNPIRYVIDIDDKPVAIIPNNNPVTEKPVDLSFSHLRSFSPVHIEYLKNMKVQSSLSISLLQNGRLWGLVICHHFSAKKISSTLLDALIFIGQIVAVKLATLEADAQKKSINQAVNLISRMLKIITNESEQSIIEKVMPVLMEIPKATGIMVQIEGKPYSYGKICSETSLKKLITWLESKSEQKIQSYDCVNEDFSDDEWFEDHVAGVMAVRISPKMNNCIIWLREEKLKTIQWAGTTEKTVMQDKNGGFRLSPRSSFDTWTENWRGRSRPWTKIEMGTSQILGELLLESLSQKNRIEILLNRHKAINSELKVTALAFQSEEGMLLADSTSTILRINHAFTEMTGYENSEVVGKKPTFLRSGRHGDQFFHLMWERINSEGKWQGEIWNKRKNGEVFPTLLTITAVKNSDGHIENYIGSYIDITQKKLEAEKLEKMAFYDPLTNLPNRRLLTDRLNHALHVCFRNGSKGALLFLDLDNFKQVNDTLGHDIGDLLLIQVADRLLNCIREVDTVARLGGDEFVVLLEDLHRNIHQARNQAEAIGKKILSVLNRPYQLSGTNYRNTPSIGITMFIEQYSGIEEIIKQADFAMYKAKQAGRNTLCFFNKK